MPRIEDMGLLEQHLLLWGLPILAGKIKEIYNRETIPLIRISPNGWNPSTSSWLADILELRKGLIIRVA